MDPSEAAPSDPATPRTEPTGTDADPARRTTPRAARRIGWLPWALRAAWIAVGVTGSSAIDAATADRSDLVAGVAGLGAGLVWLVGVAAMAVPATWTLTVTRAVVPLAVVAAVVAAFGGADLSRAVAFAVAAVIATAFAASSEVGHVFVGASAYGDELRFPLRPPIGYAVVASLAWVVWATLVVLGPLAVAARWWVPGVLACIAAAGLTALVVPRWHRLSRRWFVFVPAGVVVHDPVVLGETLMLPHSQLAGIALARAGTDAFDLTGPTSGHAIEVRTREPVTALVNPLPTHRQARAIHLTALLAAPSRPGRVVRAARDRDLPVG